MKLTKFQHACFMVEKDGSTILVDPGTFSHDLIPPHHLDAIIITHEHPDHLDEQKVNALLAKHPKATVIAHESISGRYTNYTTIAAKVGEHYTVGSFDLQFFGGAHDSIAPSIPTPPNLGVLIDGRLYYPGDSFVVPEGVTVKELALPASAPWLRIDDAMHFLEALHPEFTFPTHDAILSDEGKQLVDRLLGTVAAGQNTVYKRLDGQAITLS